MLIAYILGLAIGIAHFLSDWVNKKLKRNRADMQSLTAGIAIVYIFLVMLPESLQGFNHNKNIFYFLFFGFLIFHLIEKYFYQHEDRRELKKKLKEVHSIVFFIYHFVLGILLYKILEFGVREGLLFFIPILFFSTTTSASLEGIHGKIREKIVLKLVLSASTLAGIFVATYLSLTPSLYFSIVGFVAGSLLYVVIKDVLPEKKTGNPVYLLIGVALFMLFMLIILNVV